MRIFHIFFGILLLLPIFGHTQDRWFTKSGRIRFDATAANSPKEIVGNHSSVVCVVDKKTGALQFSALIKGFQFKVALMEEHFNENYMESDKFPKAEFRGTILDNTTVNYGKDGTYPVRVKGSMTIHGVTKEVASEGQLVVGGGRLIARSSFPVVLADYAIGVPRLVADKISTTSKVSVDCSLEPLKQ
ncbi:MAG: YceI family protein [Bacteroidetes bacterium]|nr:YceI family protein [Bacteroidota bacterium]